MLYNSNGCEGGEDSLLDLNRLYWEQVTLLFLVDEVRASRLSHADRHHSEAHDSTETE